jgi:hypothetical protein
MIKIILFLLITSAAMAQSNRVVQGGIFPNANYFTNFVKNSDADVNILNIVNASSIVTRNTTTPLFGAADFSIDATTSGQIVQFSVETYPAGIKGNCEASFSINGDASLYKVYVSDGSNKLTADFQLGNYTQRTPIALNFVCTTNARLYIESTGNGASIKVDNVYTGLATNLGTVAQAKIFGTANQVGAANCNFTENTSTGYTDYDVLGAAGSCSSAWTVTGGVTAAGPTSHKITLNNLPPGKIQVDVIAIFYGSDSATSDCFFRISDGANVFDGRSVVSQNTGVGTRNIISGYYEYATASSPTLEIQASDAGAVTCGIGNDASYRGITWIVKHFPSQSQQVVQQNSQGWFIAANIGGANPDLGTSDQTSYVEITNSGLTMTPKANSAPVGIMCSSTNAAATPTTSTSTCSVGNESLGASFNIPEVGWYKVCTQASHYKSNGVGGVIDATFQLIETPTNAQTLTQLGGGTATSGFWTASSNQSNPINTCGVFYFSSILGPKGIRLMYEQDVTSTITQNLIVIDEGATYGQRNMLITVEKISSGQQNPYFIGSVQTSSESIERIVRVSFGGATTSDNCTSSPCNIYRQNGSTSNNVSSITRASTGNYTVNFVSGVFTSIPDCSLSMAARGASTAMKCEIPVSNVTTTTVQIFCFNTTPAVQDAQVSLVCSGNK